MKENRQSPEIRMEGFEDDWIYNNLRKLAIFNPKTEPPEEFEYVDLESVVGTEMMYHRKEKSCLLYTSRLGSILWNRDDLAVSGTEGGEGLRRGDRAAGNRRR